MTQAKTINDHRFSVCTSSLNQVEFSDDNKRAILTIPLMHVGPNKKGLYWTPEMLKKVAPMFRGTAFRYDLEGKEGSSHTPNKLSSPHFDVGWTNRSVEGAKYNSDTGEVIVKGEVTNPSVIEKLERKTTDGQREINFASMGVLVEESRCSICGKIFGECEHERLKEYDGKTCYSVPTKVKKALHVALTNDPADGEAEIKDCIFQEWNMSANLPENGSGTMMNNVTSQIAGGLAPSSFLNEQQGSAPSSEMILRELAERVKTLEQANQNQEMLNAQHMDNQAIPPGGLDAAQPTPELVNQNQNAGATQDNMGVTSQIPEGGNMDKTDGQTTNKAVPVNPSDEKVKAEMQDDMGMGSDGKLDQIIQLLQQLVNKDGVQTADMGKEAQDANKSIAKKAQDNIALEHQKSPVSGGEASSGAEAVTPESEEDDGNKKNKQYMNEPGKVATADDEVEKLKAELADMKAQMNSKPEFQDNIPEFGGTSSEGTVLEAADMTAKQRREEFGEYGAFDACFNGIASASRFKR